jgi:hypothetical protein
MKNINAFRKINFQLTQRLSLCYVPTEIDDMFRLIFLSLLQVIYTRFTVHVV